MRIGRYDNPNVCVSFSAISPEVRAEPIALEVSDGAISTGILYTNGPAKTVVCFMHPQADMSRHYAVPGLLAAGYAAFAQNSRYLHNDTHCIHETLLRDVAAGQRFLRQRGFERVVLIGNSGGGSLFSFYQSQAVTAAAERIERTPAGDRTDLSREDMPAADGLILLAAHLGEGKVLTQMIDPSVTDENDPLSCDDSLDAFNPDNGYRLPPESSNYTADFVQRYRQAQRERIARIDARARAALATRRDARQRMGNADFADLSAAEQRAWTRRAAALPPFVVHRTEADLRALDLKLDPSQRNAGTLYSYRPDITNYMELGFARVTSPKAWLSTWSGISSHAALELTAPQVTAPALVVSYTGDNVIFSSDCRQAFDYLASTDKSFVEVDGDHYGYGTGSQERSGARLAVAAIVEWLDARFATT